MKTTILAMLTTAMLCAACQKETAAPTNEAIAVPKCLEGEFIAQGVAGIFFINVTNAKIGAKWTPTSNCQNLTNNGNVINFKDTTFENVVGLYNGAKLFNSTNQGVKLFAKSKLYFSIDSANIGNLQSCPPDGVVIPQIEICRPYPSYEFIFCAKTISLTKCK